MKTLNQMKPERTAYKKLYLDEKAKKLRLEDENKELKRKLLLAEKPWLKQEKNARIGASESIYRNRANI